MSELGLHPYQNTITVPRFLSRCILNTLSLNAFPIRETGGDAVLYYHQYGFSLRSAPREKIVVEDACHAFFAAATSGARSWSGQAALFSLPKFFATSGPAGALVVPNERLYERIKTRRDAAAPIEPELASWRRQVIASATTFGVESPVYKLLDSAYSLLSEYPQIDPECLHGFPSTLSQLEQAGAARRERLEAFRQQLGQDFPSFMFHSGGNNLPYALPYFGSSNRAKLQELSDALSAFDIHCGVYSVDVACSLYEPDYRPCLLIPCHQFVPLQLIKDICQLIKRSR